MFFDDNRNDAFVQDVGEENWYMAFIFLLLFLIALLYGILVTLMKVSKMSVKLFSHE